MFVYSWVEVSVGLTYVGFQATRARKFINYGALVLFGSFIFARYKTVCGGVIPVYNDFTWQFQKPRDFLFEVVY